MKNKIIIEKGGILSSILSIIPILIVACLPLELFTPWLVIYIAVYLLFIFILWAYTVGSSLISIGCRIANVSLNRYKLNLVYLLIYIVFLCVLAWWKYYNGVVQMGALFAIVLAVLSLYSFITIFYVSWSIAKSLVSIEQNKLPSFSQIFGTLIQLLIYPICIYFIHKRVQRIINTSKDSVGA